MKTNKFIILVSLVFAIILFCNQESRAGKSIPDVLVRIEINDNHEFKKFARLEIPVYTQLVDDLGVRYILAAVDDRTQYQLVDLGFSIQILDQNPTNALYYLVYTPHTIDQIKLLESANILERTSRYLLVRVSSSHSRALSQAGFIAQKLVSKPLPIDRDGSGLLEASAITHNPTIQEMVDQVNPNTAYGYIGDLSGEWAITVNDRSYRFYSRYSFDPTPIKLATKFVYEHFINLGLTAYFDHFTLDGIELRHVIAEQPGLTYPDRVVLLVAHLDSTVIYSDIDNLPSYAPGADDNASGSAGVMVVADILHQYDFAYTLRYITFTGEEQVVHYDYFGSKFYAEEQAANGEDIIAVINLDMIGYNSDQYEIIELHTRPGNSGDLAIANLFKSVIQTYDINLTTQVLEDGLSWSDHASFWDEGYHAILAMEDYQDFTPYYHSTGDQLSTINSTYLADFIKAAVGTTAHLAGPLPPLPEQFYLPIILHDE